MATDFQAVLRLAMASVREARPDEALAHLRRIAHPNDPFARQNQYARLVKSLSPQLPAWPVLRVAILSGSTVDPLIDILGVWLLLAGFRLEAYNAPFNAWRQEAMDAASGLYAFKPDFVWFFLTARDLQMDQAPITADSADGASLAALRDVVGAVKQVSQTCRVPVFINNAEASAARALGNLEGQHSLSRAGRLRQYNLGLSTALPPGCTIFDLDHQAACFGLHRWEDARLWFHSKHPFALEAFGPVAFAGSRLLVASRGRSRKCIVLDLDNTLWGGVVGDDGPGGVSLGASGGAAGEAFVAFQTYLKALSSRGIALAVCSKNDDALAREPFKFRSEMVLKLDDFAVFQANWANKADNLRSIAAAMNIGTDSMVFVDDNPAERTLVRTELPEVAVVEMPQDPSDYVSALAAGGWFETLAISDEDRLRSKAYRDNAARAQATSDSTDIETYLRSLDMHASWNTADPSRLPRMSQLLNKTNQFQLTDRRYSEAELTALSSDPVHWVGWFSLRDQFGDHGLISVVVVRIDNSVAFIDAWAMSCRVFSRGMESLIVHVLRRELARKACKTLVGRYMRSNKNGVVCNLYESLGGRRLGVGLDASAGDACWQFDLTAPQPPSQVFIIEQQSAGCASASAFSTHPQ